MDRTTDPLWAATFRVELAKVLLYQGSPKVATLLEQPLPAGSRTDLLVRRNLLLAIAEARLGNAGKALQALAAAEALHPEAGLHAEMLSAQGHVAHYQGRLEEAQHLFEQSLAEATEYNSPFLEMETWMNRGAVAIDREHYEDAIDFFNRATVIAHRIGARLALEKALGNLSSTYYHTGDFARALENGRAAEVQAKALGSTLDQVQILLNVGMCQVLTDDLTGARSSFEHSLAIAETLRNPEKILNAHIALAYLLLRQHPEAAASHIHEAVRLAEVGHDPTEQVEPALLEALLLTQQGQDAAAEVKLRRLVTDSTAFPSLQWAAESTLAVLYANANRSNDADHWFEQAIATFHRQRLSLKSVELELPFLENGSDLYLGYMEHLIRTHRPDQALQVLDQSRAETLAEGLGVQDKVAAAPVTSARALAARLHGTILVYCLRPQASYLWASSASKQQFYILPGSLTLHPLIERHTQAILASKDLLAQPDPPGSALYDALVKPAEPFLKPGGRVFIIADKELGGLNFETLIPSTGQPHYWIEDATVINARSLRLLAASQERSTVQTGEKMLLIGNPVYRGEEYAALPNAPIEMTRIASHFAPDHRSIFSSAEASPLVYTTSNPGRFRYIHFVAHATANETTPLDSAIILSGQPGASKLYARDILKQPLTAELVTLSSCFGSGTRDYSGEGVVGLVWAFLRAGAHSVIGAMWEVSDVSTPQLMDALYAELLANHHPDAALRSAKLSLLHSGGVFRKPLYWASFQLYSGR